MSVKETAAHLIDGMDGRARAYVQVQNGCDHRCTFCIIPYGRGNSRSVPAGEVVEQVRRLVETGHYEVVLTGVDLTSWGADLPGTPQLGNLVQRILKLVPQLKQLRISSIDAIEIDDALFEAMGEPRLAPFMHLSLQHGDNLILKRMKRRHSRDDAIALAEKCAPCVRISHSAQTSSQGFQPRLRRISRTQSVLWMIAASPSCTSFPTARGPARPPPECPAGQGRDQGTRGALARSGRKRAQNPLFAPYWRKAVTFWWSGKPPPACRLHPRKTVAGSRPSWTARAGPYNRA
jgi:hypothetical protein